MSEVLDLFNGSKKEIPDIRYVLPGSGKELFLKPFTTRDQKNILKALEKEDSVLIQEAFDQLLRNCVLTEGFDPDTLYTKDRECLLIYLSKESVKDSIDHTWECKKCDKTNILSINIADLKYEEPVAESIVEEIVEFESHNFVVKLKNTTRADEKKIIALGKKNGTKDNISQTDVLVGTFASVIKEYKKVTTKTISTDDGPKEIEREIFEPIKFEDRIKIFEPLSITDKKKIEKYFNNLKSYGYDLVVDDVKCKHCSNEGSVKMGWMDFFIM